MIESVTILGLSKDVTSNSFLQIAQYTLPKLFLVDIITLSQIINLAPIH